MVSYNFIMEIKFPVVPLYLYNEGNIISAIFYYSIVIFAEVSEVIDAIVYLLSDRSSMINGVALPVDGGFLAM